MISASKTAAAMREKQDRNDSSKRILELREKIHDKSYLDNAIGRIAQVVSRRLVEEPDAFFLKTTSAVPELFQGVFRNGKKQ